MRDQEVTLARRVKDSSGRHGEIISPREEERRLIWLKNGTSHVWFLPDGAIEGRLVRLSDLVPL